MSRSVSIGFRFILLSFIINLFNPYRSPRPYREKEMGGGKRRGKKEKRDFLKRETKGLKKKKMSKTGKKKEKRENKKKK